MPLLAGSNWGNDVARRGLHGRAGHRHQLALQRGRPRLLPHAGHSADRRPRVHARRRRSARRRSRSSTRRSRRSSTSDATRSASAWASGDGKLDIEIVGLVQNAKYSEVKDEIPPLFFRPYRQDDAIGSDDVLRPDRGRSGRSCWRRFRRSSRRSIPTCRSRTCKTMPQQVRDNVFLDRFISMLSAGVRRAGDAAGGGRPLRRARLHRGAADARDRPAHGARRGAGARARHGAAAGRADDAGRRRDRPGRGDRRRPAAPSRMLYRAEGLGSGGARRGRRRRSALVALGAGLHSRAAARRESIRCAR